MPRRTPPSSAPARWSIVGRFDLAEFAVVLEPDEPLRTARRAFYAGMAALADALAAHAPPEKPIAFVWPDAIEIDGGLVGGGQLAWPDGPEDEPPPWLVFGGMIRTVSMAEGDPGLRPLSAALEDEGFDDFGSGAAGRELRAPSDGAGRRAGRRTASRRWRKDYLPRLAPEKGVQPRHRRQRRSAGAAHRQGRVERRKLVPALQAPPAGSIRRPEGRE